ncbi:MAG: vitamin B12-dependent ribonucleotide reductase [Candidatus Omnitrophota bacterium]
MTPKLSDNAMKVLEKRYLKKDANGKVIETPEQMFRRVAHAIAIADKAYNKTEKEIQETEDAFYRIMASLEFIPNSPCLMNAGKDMGQLSACFSPNQIIITKNGPKIISEIKAGDYVLTHQNRFRKVNKVFTRRANEIYSISAYKLPTSTLKVTAEHPILAIKNKDRNNFNQHWISVKDLSIGDYIALAFPKEIIDIDTISVSDFVKDENIMEKKGYLYEKNKDIRFYIRKDKSVYVQDRNRSGDVSKQVTPIKNKIGVDKDLMRLFGYYLSEGCVSENRSLRFVFSLEERNYAEDVLNIVRNKFDIYSHVEETNSADRKWISIRFHSKILAQFFINLFGTGYNIKRIPHWMITLAVEKQKGLLSGMFRGDSCTFKNGNNFSTQLVMCNEQLVYSAWQMLARIGIFPSLNLLSMPKLGRVQPVKCQVSGKEGTKLINEFLEEEFPHNDIEFKREIICEGRIFTPITEITKQGYNGIVYNLEVEEDHSYCANMVAVHNCFVLPIEDSMDSIFESLKATAMIHKSGGGTGFSFSRLRPKNAVVKTTGGIASGPISFMRVYDAATEAVKQGGTRRGANMGILRVDHPDIMEFITCKENDKQITNFNISVAITDEFMQKLEKAEDYDLIDPRTHKAAQRINSKEVFDLIIKQAHKNGEPGIIFIDRMNKFNPTPKLGKYESTNPCGEQILLPYESCDLGSINLYQMYKEAKDSGYEIDWEKLREVTRLAVHFLDNIIDVNKFPLPQIEKATRETRKIGLGVMGWASLLIRLGIPYNSEEAVALAEKVMAFILQEATKKSLELGKEKGVFPAFSGSIYDKEEGASRLRNATLTTIAPTGTISIIASPCSSGIEPLFAISYYRNVMDNDKLVEVEPLFEEIARRRGFYSRALMEKIAESASLKDIEEIPEDIKRVFVTSHDISPQWHVKMQAAFQKYVHNATSKTINFPHEATVENVREAYLLSYELNCKGLTIYRDRSREEQVLNVGTKDKEFKPEQKFLEPGKISPRPRPEVIIGTTTKVATGCGNLYVTINIDEQSRPFELFTQMGKAGGCAASQLEALGRLVSLGFRSGIEVKSIIEQLRNIRCPSPSWEKGQRIFSCSDAIARVIEKRLVNKALSEIPSETVSIVMKHSHNDEVAVVHYGDVIGVCPDCGGTLRHEEGCVKCQACGYSKC